MFTQKKKNKLFYFFSFKKNKKWKRGLREPHILNIFSTVKCVMKLEIYHSQTNVLC